MPLPRNIIQMCCDQLLHPQFQTALYVSVFNHNCISNPIIRLILLTFNFVYQSKMPQEHCIHNDNTLLVILQLIAVSWPGITNLVCPANNSMGKSTHVCHPN